MRNPGSAGGARRENVMPSRTTRSMTGRLRTVRVFFYKYWLTLCAIAACAGVGAGVPQITHIFSLPVPDLSGGSGIGEAVSATLLWCFVVVLPLAYAWVLVRGLFPRHADKAAPAAAAAQPPAWLLTLTLFDAGILTFSIVHADAHAMQSNRITTVLFIGP